MKTEYGIPKKDGRVPSAPGSREPSPDGLGPSGFDPSREVERIQAELYYEALSKDGEDVAYAFDEGRKFALRQAIAIAEKWRDQNRAAATKAQKSMSEAARSMVDQLDGAAIECNAIAHELIKLLPQGARRPSDEEIEAWNLKTAPRRECPICGRELVRPDRCTNCAYTGEKG